MAFYDYRVDPSPTRPLTVSGMCLHLECKPLHMENEPNKANAPLTRADLRTEVDEFEEKLDKKLDESFSEQANVILEAVWEVMDKKLDEKFDPVITKLDGILKGVDSLQQENIVGAEQLRRHEDQLQKHETHHQAGNCASVNSSSARLVTM